MFANYLLSLRQSSKFLCCVLSLLYTKAISATRHSVLSSSTTRYIVWSSSTYLVPRKSDISQATSRGDGTAQGAAVAAFSVSAAVIVAILVVLGLLVLMVFWRRRKYGNRYSMLQDLSNVG